ncbi:hypothetical protein WJX72_002477 [[Myrmecia] bisecta]|uniref:mannan endo-1,4-beta-mannosidase n=1 Tax=[Myrmecia] bisecta TaxID=41462 RepID=A0AAW1QEL8_9CHLO
MALLSHVQALCTFLLLLSTAASAQSRGIASAQAPFVKASGTQFVVNGRPFFFAGTNAFYLTERSFLNDAQISEFFQVNADKGVTAVRTWAFINGYGTSYSTPNPFQPSPGVYKEENLKRLDLVLAEAAKHGIRVILMLGNFEPESGGMSWYVSEILGSGHAKEEFYTNAQVITAYKNYVQKIVTRINTFTGIAYKDDPTVLAWECMNEPHTTDLYENTHGMVPGKLAYDWLAEMSAFIKALDGNHMVSTGEEGYRADRQTTAAHAIWIDTGFKGVDFVKNCGLPTIDFCTVHVYPDNWAIKAWEHTWVGDNFIRDRAAVAHAAGKPIIMEECGMMAGYLPSRNDFLNWEFGVAVDAGYAGVLVWQVHPWAMESYGTGSYNFAYGWDGSDALYHLYSRMKALTG